MSDTMCILYRMESGSRYCSRYSCDILPEQFQFRLPLRGSYGPGHPAVLLCWLLDPTVYCSVASRPVAAETHQPQFHTPLSFGRSPGSDTEPACRRYEEEDHTAADSLSALFSPPRPSFVCSVSSNVSIRVFLPDPRLSYPVMLFNRFEVSLTGCMTVRFNRSVRTILATGYHRSSLPAIITAVKITPDNPPSTYPTKNEIILFLRVFIAGVGILHPLLFERTPSALVRWTTAHAVLTGFFLAHSSLHSSAHSPAVHLQSSPSRYSQP